MKKKKNELTQAQKEFLDKCAGLLDKKTVIIDEDPLYNPELTEPKIMKESKYKGFTYKIITIGRHPNAYIKIPKKHMLYEVPYSKIQIDVHGGLTYSALEEDGYWIGWDYAHWNDHYVYKLPAPINKLNEDGNKKWTIKEIEEECKSVIRQIQKLKKFRVKEYYYAVKENGG